MLAYPYLAYTDVPGPLWVDRLPKLIASIGEDWLAWVWVITILEA